MNVKQAFQNDKTNREQLRKSIYMRIRIFKFITIFKRRARLFVKAFGMIIPGKQINAIIQHLKRW